MEEEREVGGKGRGRGRRRDKMKEYRKRNIRDKLYEFKYIYIFKRGDR